MITKLFQAYSVNYLHHKKSFRNIGFGVARVLRVWLWSLTGRADLRRLTGNGKRGPDRAPISARLRRFEQRTSGQRSANAT
jgi:hypothetical protein